MTATNKTLQAARIPLFKGVSCVTILETANPAGSKCANYFDVPDENFADGGLTGVRAAFEIMASAHNGDFDSFQTVHEAAYKVLSDSADNPHFARDGAGAANSYLYIMSQILELAAKNLDLSELMLSSLSGHEEMLQDGLDEIKANNAAFVDRMKAAKKAKRAMKLAQQ